MLYFQRVLNSQKIMGSAILSCENCAGGVRPIAPAALGLPISAHHARGIVVGPHPPPRPYYLRFPPPGKNRCLPEEPWGVALNVMSFPERTGGELLPRHFESEGPHCGGRSKNYRDRTGPTCGGGKVRGEWGEGGENGHLGAVRILDSEKL